jgi:hypothetical protein
MVIQRQHLSTLALPLLLLAVGTLAVFWPTIVSHLALMQTDPGDTRLNNYILEHGYRWLCGDELHRSFWDPPFFWPLRNVAAYSEILLGGAPVYWIPRAMGVVPDTAFQIWMMVTLALDYLAAFVLLRYGVRSSITAAAIGAFVFAFANARVTQLGHQQLLPQYFSVLVAYCLFTSFRRLREQNSANNIAVILAFAFLVLQLYASFYLGWFLVFGLVVLGCCSVFAPGGRSELLKFLLVNRTAVASGLGISILALSWMGYHYITAGQDIGHRPWRIVAEGVPRLQSWLYMGPGNLLYGWLYKHTSIGDMPMAHEHAIGVGLCTLLLCVYGAHTHWHKLWVRILTYATLSVVLLAMTYPFGFSPWVGVWKYLPGASVIRAVARICLLLLIPVSIGVALGIDSIKRPVVVFVLVALVCLEQAHVTSYYDKGKVRERVATVSSLVSDQCRSFYLPRLSFSGGGMTDPEMSQLDAMWTELAVSKPTLNGHSGQDPPAWRLFDKRVRSKAELLGLRQEIKSWADRNGLDPRTIGVIGVEPEAQLPDFAPGLRPDPSGNLRLDIGTEPTRQFLGFGWSGNETKGSKSWVWAEGEYAVLYVPLHADVAYDMKMTARPMVVPGRVQTVKVFLNGSFLKRIELAPALRSYGLRLPRDKVKSFNTIELEFAYSASPARIKGSHDRRRLSVKVTSFEFMPAGGNAGRM